VRVGLAGLGRIALMAVRATEVEMRIALEYVFSDYIAHVIIRPNRGRSASSPLAFG
jgi:hypothetical protein